AEGACGVTEAGRGNPVSPHQNEPRRSAAEIIMTTLHAGGKFGGEGYKISGGLHGVGVSVVNALSTRLDLEIHREGSRWEQHFAKGGVPQGRLKKMGTSKRRGAGTTFWPDPAGVEDTPRRAPTATQRLRA